MGKLRGAFRTPDSAHAALVVGGIALALGGAALFGLVAHTRTPWSTQRVVGLVPLDALARVDFMIPKPGSWKGKGASTLALDTRPMPLQPVEAASVRPLAAPPDMAKSEFEGPPPKPVVLTRTSDVDVVPASLVKPEAVEAEPEPAPEVIEAKLPAAQPEPAERTRVAEMTILEAKWTKPMPPQPAPVEIANAVVLPKVAETKHPQTKQAAPKLAETKHAEPKPAKPAVRLAEAKPAARPAETKRVETRSAPAKVAEAKRVESKPAKTRLAEVRHSEPRPLTKPVASKAAEPKRIKTRSVGIKLSAATSADSRPVSWKVAQAQQADAKRAEAKRLAELKVAEAKLAETKRATEMQASEARWAEMKRVAERQAAEAKLADVKHAAEMQAVEAKLAEAQHAAEMQAAEAKLAQTKREMEATLAQAKVARAKLDETRHASEAASNPVRPAAARYAMCETCGTVTSVTLRALDRSTNRVEVRVHFLTGDNLYFVYPNDPGFSSGDHVRLQGGRLLRM